MSELRHRDFREAITITQAALECESLTAFETETLERLERFVGAHSSVYFDIKIDATKPAKTLKFVSGLTHGVSRPAATMWCKQYRDQDPFVKEFFSIPTSSKRRVVRSNEVISEKEYRSSRFYNEFMKPQAVHHVMVLGLRTEHRTVGLFGLHRPAAVNEFSAYEAEKLQLISSHLSAAVDRLKTAGELALHKPVLDLVTDKLPNKGVVVLSDQLNLAYENQGGLFCSLPLSVYQACAGMQKELLENDTTNDTLLVTGRELRLPGKMNVLVHPLVLGKGRFGFVLYLFEQNKNQGNSLQLAHIGFTRRQSDVYRLLDLGLTNAEIGENLNISIRTVQNHLRAMYRKLNVHTRTSLLHKIRDRIGCCEHSASSTSPSRYLT